MMMSLMKRSVRGIGDSSMKMLLYAKNVNPDLTEFLVKNGAASLEGKVESSHWDVMMSFSKKQHFIEKSVLYDPKVGEEIAKILSRKTEAGPETVFIDIFGGLGIVPMEVHRKRLFKEIFVSEEKLNEALRWKTKSFKESDGFYTFKRNLLNDKILYNLIRNEKLFKEDRFWENPSPFVTIFGITSHASIKRYTYAYVPCDYLGFLNLSFNFIFFRLKQYHVALADKGLVTSLYNFGRPEFFFVVSQRTFVHLNAQPGQLMMRNASNVLFQLLFDMEVVGTLPRQSFLPWKTFFNKKTPTYEKLFPDMESNFYLIHARPRKNLEQIHSPSSIAYFPFFLRALLGKRKAVVYNVLDTFIPNMTNYLRESSGIRSDAKTGFLKNSEITTLFNLMVEHRDFKNSTFKEAAMDYEKESNYLDFAPKDMSDIYEAQRKTLSLSGSLDWNMDSIKSY